MPYATIQDMLARYGEIEMIRLSVLDGNELTEINSDAVNRALITASAKIDSFLRRRYQTPVATQPVLPELNDACIIMARYDLSFGGQKEPSEQVRLQHKQVIEWLEGVRDGRILLPDAIPTGEESFAQCSGRGFTSYADDGDPTGTNSNSPRGIDVPPGSQLGGFW